MEYRDLRHRHAAARPYRRSPAGGDGGERDPALDGARRRRPLRHGDLVRAARAATPVTRTTFGTATPIAIAPPAAAGTVESRTVPPPIGALFYGLRAVDEAGNAGPLASVGVFDVRHLRLTRVGAGRDGLTLAGRVQALLASLGLPGPDLTITLANGGGSFFSARVPAAALTPNARGTKLRFRDSTGTVANGIRALTIGGSKRTELTIRARGLDLAGAEPGPFTATLGIDNLELSTVSALRATGSKLVSP